MKITVCNMLGLWKSGWQGARIANLPVFRGNYSALADAGAAATMWYITLEKSDSRLLARGLKGSS